ncbi:MAG TPA: hypothetical protein VLB44_13160, partial [Kofleriaceae bacterium]|nr:hypothetical protein [Kofleriaceae bacterium]
VSAGDATLTFTAAADLSHTKVTAVHIPDSLVEAFKNADPAQLRTFFFGRLAENRLESAVPHRKGTAAARYALSGFSALLRANYYGPVYYRPDQAENDEVFGAKVLFDVDLGYQATKTMYLSIGGDNVLNTFPDKQKKDANISSGRFIYSRNVSQFGQNGGFYYAKLELTFF